MSPVGTLVVSSMTGAMAVVLVATGWRQERPALDRVITRLRRPGHQPTPEHPPGMAHGLGRLVIAAGGRYTAYLPTDVSLRLSGRTREIHAAHMLVAAIVGLTGPILLLACLQFLGVVPLGIHVPVLVALLGAVLAPIAVHGRVEERAQEVRIDLRYQLSAYLDVVTMLLAGNSGHEGALEQAAHAGDGRLFTELRRRMREAGASGRSLVDALEQAGRDLGLVELQQVAATASLSAAEGAPVARTLSAKCATLRSTLASEQESEARMRTSRLTPPLVGMSLIFMALVIYPALSFPG